MESLRGFLHQKERELTHQLAALRREIAEKEAELAELRTARAAIPTTNHLAAADLAGTSTLLAQATLISGPTTIRELAVKALREHFPSGASPAELREFIRDAYDRDIDRASLSPQLSKLKEEGLVMLDEERGVWLPNESLKELALERLRKR